MVEWSENPKSKEERRREWSERKAKEAEAKRVADPTVGLCFADGWTTIQNIDGLNLLAAKAIPPKVPPEFEVGYKVRVKSINKESGTAVVTSNRKLRGKEWEFTVRISNLECFYGLGATPPPRGETPPPGETAPPRTPPGERPKPKATHVILIRPMAGLDVGTKIPVQEETPTHYRAKHPDWPNAVGFDKRREGLDYSVEREAESDIPLPPEESGAGEAGTPPGGTGTPPGEVPKTQAWQLVDTVESRKRREELKSHKPLILKIPPIYYALGKHFVWAKDFDRDVFASVFMIPNSSLVLKGVPGTGKTQLIEMATLMFANDFRVPGVNLDVFNEIGQKIGVATENRRYLTQWLLDRGILGSVKHNSDKEIQDVFFFTKINIERYSMPLGTSSAPPLSPPEPPKEMPPETKEIPKERILDQIEKEIKGETTAKPPTSADSLFETDDDDIFGISPNPLPIKWRGTFKQHPDKLDVYDITPEPRQIVYSLIKFHNEANRMNANVADVLLGLMSEQEVEYQGKKFVSPVRYKEGEGLLWDKSADTGSISFFDYNPHLEVDHPEMELDRALLDRITAGFYLSAGSTAMRFEIMDKKSKDIPQPREVIFKCLKEGQIMSEDGKTMMPFNPISREELKELWLLVNGSRGGLTPSCITVDAEAMAWVAWMTNLPNLTNKKYGGAYTGNLRPGVPIAGQPIDRTLTTFKQALDAMESIRPRGGGASGGGGGIAEDEQMAIEGLQRPFGVRSAESMLSMLRATTFLYKSTRRGWKPDDFVIYPSRGEREREKLFDDLCELLPYILDHRINLGVGPDLKSEFLSTFDMIKFYFVPLMKRKKPVLFSIMDGLMSVYVENQNREMQGLRRLNETEKATKFREVLYNKLAQRAPNTNFDVIVKEESLVFTLVDLLSAM